MHFPNLVRNGRRLWDQFCEYTELPGFRFMTSKVTLLIRLAAVSTFLFSLLAMSAQLWYLIGQYLRNQVQTSSRKYRIQQMALPIVYLCHPLNGTRPLQLLDLCRDSVFEHGSPDLASTKEMAQIVPFCTYHIKLLDYPCELRCKWTSQGFCIEARLNATSARELDFSIATNSTTQQNSTASKMGDQLRRDQQEEEVNDFQVVTDYDIQLFFNSTISPDAAEDTLPLALVFLRFAADAIKWPTQIPLVGAAHLIMQREALNVVQVVEILKITRNDLPDSMVAPVNSSFEFCVWRTNSELAGNWSCPSEHITSIFAQNHSDFTNTTYGVSECTLARAQAAQEKCREDRVFNRFTVRTAIFTRSPAEREGQDPTTSPNLRIYPTDIVMQETLHQLRSAEWKMLSEIGGTLALYLGFTLMSLLEALVFFSVTHVRRVARQLDEESLLARKNPPIRWKGAEVARKLQQKLAAIRARRRKMDEKDGGQQQKENY